MRSFRNERGGFRQRYRERKSDGWSEDREVPEVYGQAQPRRRWAVRGLAQRAKATANMSSLGLSSSLIKSASTG